MKSMTRVMSSGSSAASFPLTARAKFQPYCLRKILCRPSGLHGIAT